MAENRFKLKLSRIFRTSLASCRSKHLSLDATQSSILSPQTLHSFRTVNQNDDEQYLKTASKTSSFSSIICRPKPKPTKNSEDCINSTMNVMLPSPRRPKLSKPAFHRRYTSSVFPLNPFYEQSKSKKTTKKKSQKSQRRQYKKATKRELFPFSSSSLDSNLGGWWFSSDDDGDGSPDCDNGGERESLFSSKSLSSDSSELLRRRSRRRMGLAEVGLEGLMRVKDSFAVVKKSSDPHGDFRTSMVEMIVEKQIFSAKDLETLLQCFLSLNSESHHGVIVEVFTEILEALFSNWGS